MTLFLYVRICAGQASFPSWDRGVSDHSSHTRHTLLAHLGGACKAVSTMNRTVKKKRESLWSIGSEASILSIGSKGSILSIGSVGSVLSIGSVGSAFSFASIGSFASFGSLLSAASDRSILSWRSRKAVAHAPDY